MDDLPGFWARLRVADTLLPEVFNSTLSIAWGLWLLMPMDSFHSSIPGLALMGVFAPEPAWGVIILVIGLWQIAAVYVGNRTRRRIGMIISAAMWTFIATFVTLANPHSTGTVVYSMLALSQCAIYLCAGARWTHLSSSRS